VSQSLSTTIDDLLSSENTGTSNFDSTVNSVKRKLLTKKKSIELSLENIKILKNRSSSNLGSVQSKPENERLITSISEHSVLQKSVENVKNIEDEHLKDPIEVKTTIKNEVKFFPDVENEFDGLKTPIIETKIEKKGLNSYKYKIIFFSITVYYFLNIPSFLNGLFIGVLITSLVAYLYFKLNFKNLQKNNIVNDKNEKQRQEISQLHKLFVVEKCDKNFCGVYKVNNFKKI
jgi:hypothetical protein